MKIAVAQLEALALDPVANARVTTEAIASAAAEGADLVVLPELIASGYVFDAEGIGGVAEPGDGSGLVLSAWRVAAREHDIAVIGGYAERDGEALYNSVAVIERGGEIAGGYRKLHLFGREHEQFERGDLGLPVFELDGVRVGVLVCYDLRFPETLRLLALEGAEVVAVPTAWVAGFDARVPADDESIGQVDGALVQANLNQVFVACADQSGAHDGITFLGRSVVASPYGEAIVGPLPARGGALEVVEIDVADVARAADRGPGISPRKDRRTDVYELTRVAATAGAGNGSAPVDGAALLAEMEQKRGYVLDLHRTLAARDPEFLVDYEHILSAAFLRERSLTRREKELVYIGVLTALSTPQSHLVAHMRAAVAAGATEQEVLETVEMLMPPVGVPRFIEAMAAFDVAFPPETTKGP